MYRNWYKFDCFEENVALDRFDYADYVLAGSKHFKERFDWENFSKNKMCLKIYSHLKNNLKKKDTLFIGSSWGWWEYFLNKELKVIASDVNKDYSDYHKKNTDLKYITLNILEEDPVKSINNKYDQVVVNSIDYLFDENQLDKSIKNLNKIVKNDGEVFVIFRSRDGLLQKIIDNFLCYLETKIIFFLKKFKKKVFFIKSHHGFRRNLNDFIKYYEKNNFEFKSIDCDMFEDEYERLRIVKKFKIGRLLSLIFLKSHPLLNIITFKNF